MIPKLCHFLASVDDQFWPKYYPVRPIADPVNFKYPQKQPAIHWK